MLKPSHVEALFIELRHGTLSLVRALWGHDPSIRGWQIAVELNSRNVKITRNSSNCCGNGACDGCFRH